MSKKLDNKIAIVTGGNSGIGFAAAKRFAEEGAQVYITGRRAEAVEEAAGSLGENVHGIVADAASSSDTDRLIEHVKSQHGRIDVLFLNAGVAPFAPISEVDEASFDQVFGINVKGLFFTLQKALPLLNPGSSVILNASVVSKGGFANASVYAASKAAVRSIGQSAAAELGPQGIRVNILSPGPVETPIYSKTGLPEEVVQGMGEQLATGVPLGRFGTSEEMANVALFLASDESSFINGSDIQADGGMTQVLG